MFKHQKASTILISNISFFLLAVILSWNVPNIIGAYWIESIPLFLLAMYIHFFKSKENLKDKIGSGLVLILFFVLPGYFLIQKMTLSPVLFLAILFFLLTDLAVYKKLWKGEKMNKITFFFIARLMMGFLGLAIDTPFTALFLFLALKTWFELIYSWFEKMGATWN